MTVKLKQSTASQEICLGVFVDETDGFTAETGLTIANTDIKLWKMGATTLASKNSGGATHISGGIYYAVLDDTDTDTLGALIIYCHVSGARPVILECEVLAANVYDSLIPATDRLQVDVREKGLSTMGLTTEEKANVNAEALDVLATDTHAELSAVPAATSSLKDKISWLFALARNKITQTATTQVLRNDDDDGNIASSTVSDDGTTAARGEFS